MWKPTPENKKTSIMNGAAWGEEMMGAGNVLFHDLSNLIKLWRPLKKGLIKN